MITKPLRKNHFSTDGSSVSENRKNSKMCIVKIFESTRTQNLNPIVAV